MNLNIHHRMLIAGQVHGPQVYYFIHPEMDWTFKKGTALIAVERSCGPEMLLIDVMIIRAGMRFRHLATFGFN